MTATVTIDGYPDRLACEACGCVVGARREGEPWRPILPEGVSWPGWVREVEVDEPPPHINVMDGCPCHDSYIRITTFPY